jgi:hypothetical protein
MARDFEGVKSRGEKKTGPQGPGGFMVYGDINLRQRIKI